MIISKIIQHSVTGGEDTLTTLPLTNFCSLDEVPFENIKRTLFSELQGAMFNDKVGTYRNFFRTSNSNVLQGFEFNYNGVNLGIIQTTIWSAKCMYTKQESNLRKNFLSLVTPPVAINIIPGNRVSTRRCRNENIPRERYMSFSDTYSDNVVVVAIRNHRKEIIDLANKLISKIPGVSTIDDIIIDDFDLYLKVVPKTDLKNKDYIGGGNYIQRFTVYNSLVIAAFCYMSCIPEEREDVSLLDFPVLMFYAGTSNEEIQILKSFQKILPLSQVIYVAQKVQTPNK